MDLTDAKRRVVECEPMFARGLSVRDIEAAFTDDQGRLLLSKTAVSELSERLWQDYEAFASRDLSEFDLLYLFVDGIAERLHLGQPREAVLAAWGITLEGKKVLLHLAPGTKEDTASCREFYQDMRRRGLRDPLLAVTDGAPGLIRATEECLPRTGRQRCLAHKMRNLQSKVPEPLWPEFKACAIACYQAASPALARLLRDEIVTTNLLERLFGEKRRCTKVIPHAFGECAVLKLMYGALIRAAERWRGLRVTEFELRQLKVIREELDRLLAERTAPACSPTSPTRLSSKMAT